MWSAIGLFSIGCGLGLSHAWHAWQESHNTAEQVTVKSTLFESIDPLTLAMAVLLIALLVESWVLKAAWREFAQRARMNGHQNALSYLSQSDDPTLVAVLLEDAVAVIGVLLAAIGIALTHVTGIVLWDIGFSVVIAVMLGITAVFLGMINMRFLSDVRDQEAEETFRLIVDAHKEIERYHDLRNIVIDDRNTVLVDEIELKGRVSCLPCGKGLHSFELKAAPGSPIWIVVSLGTESFCLTVCWFRPHLNVPNQS